ncbi:MAG: CAP domain-containing protein [Acidimicrobiia bacterium]|nr:CAP domain-containing protein [Acidimicrobiia bacterium]
MGLASPAVAASPGDEAHLANLINLINLINQARSAHGLAPLHVDGHLTGMARRWSDGMAARGALAHNPNLGAQAPTGWSRVGENVAVGGSAQAAFDALMGSPRHRANILKPDFTHVGVGVTRAADGRIFITQDFAQLPGGAPAPPPPPPPPTTAPPTTLARHLRPRRRRPPPPTTAPPTTVAPTTTSTTAPPTTTATSAPRRPDASDSSADDDSGLRAAIALAGVAPVAAAWAGWRRWRRRHEP